MELRSKNHRERLAFWSLAAGSCFFIAAIATMTLGDDSDGATPEWRGPIELDEDVGPLILRPTSDVTALDTLSGETVVVLAFRHDCPHCDAVGPLWADWASRNPTVRVIGLTTDLADIASNYASMMGWTFPSYTVRTTDPEALRAMAARVPWVHVIDAAGKISYTGLGANMQPVDSVALPE